MAAETCYRCENEIPNCQKTPFRTKGIVLCMNCAKHWQEHWKKKLDEIFWEFLEN